MSRKQAVLVVSDSDSGSDSDNDESGSEGDGRVPQLCKGSALLTSKHRKRDSGSLVSLMEASVAELETLLEKLAAGSATNDLSRFDRQQRHNSAQRDVAVLQQLLTRVTELHIVAQGAVESTHGGSSHLLLSCCPLLRIELFLIANLHRLALNPNPRDQADSDTAARLRAHIDRFPAMIASIGEGSEDASAPHKSLESLPTSDLSAKIAALELIALAALRCALFTKKLARSIHVTHRPDAATLSAVVDVLESTRHLYKDLTRAIHLKQPVIVEEDAANDKLPFQERVNDYSFVLAVLRLVVEDTQLCRDAVDCRCSSLTATLHNKLQPLKRYLSKASVIVPLKHPLRSHRSHCETPRVQSAICIARNIAAHFIVRLRYEYFRGCRNTPGMESQSDLLAKIDQHLASLLYAAKSCHSESTQDPSLLLSFVILGETLSLPTISGVNADNPTMRLIKSAEQVMSGCKPQAGASPTRLYRYHLLALYSLYARFAQVHNHIGRGDTSAGAGARIRILSAMAQELREMNALLMISQPSSTGHFGSVVFGKNDGNGDSFHFLHDLPVSPFVRHTCLSGPKAHALPPFLTDEEAAPFEAVLARGLDAVAPAEQLELFSRCVHIQLCRLSIASGAYAKALFACKHVMAWDYLKRVHAGTAEGKHQDATGMLGLSENGTASTFTHRESVAVRLEAVEAWAATPWPLLFQQNADSASKQHQGGECHGMSRLHCCAHHFVALARFLFQRIRPLAHHGNAHDQQPKIPSSSSSSVLASAPLSYTPKFAKCCCPASQAVETAIVLFENCLYRSEEELEGEEILEEVEREGQLTRQSVNADTRASLQRQQPVIDAYAVLDRCVLPRAFRSALFQVVSQNSGQGLEPQCDFPQSAGSLLMLLCLQGVLSRRNGFDHHRHHRHHHEEGRISDSGAPSSFAWFQKLTGKRAQATLWAIITRIALSLARSLPSSEQLLGAQAFSTHDLVHSLETPRSKHDHGLGTCNDGADGDGGADDNPRKRRKDGGSIKQPAPREDGKDEQVSLRATLYHVLVRAAISSLAREAEPIDIDGSEQTAQHTSHGAAEAPSPVSQHAALCQKIALLPDMHQFLASHPTLEGDFLAALRAFKKGGQADTTT